MSRRFQVNAPGVVSEVIDGEAIIMNLRSGHYFSAQGVGASLWIGLKSGSLEADIATHVTTHYAMGAAEVTVALASFIRELATHDLVVDRDTRA